MKYYGEKFIKKEIVDNKISKIYEYKIFEDIDFDKIVSHVNDYITDDPEELYTTYGIALDYNDFYGLDTDILLEALEERQDDMGEDYSEFIKDLENAQGFYIRVDMEAKNFLEGAEEGNNQVVLTIIGTKDVKKEDSEYEIYTKDEAVERIREMMDDGYGFSIVQARK